MHAFTRTRPSNVKTPEEVNVDDLLNDRSEPGCFGKNGTYWDRPGRSDPFASMMGAANASSGAGDVGSFSSASAAGGESSLFDMWL